MAVAMTAEAALARHFNEARSRVLDLAAILDRIERGDGAVKLAGDRRLSRMREAVAALLEGPVNRTERVQMIFSLPYDAAWQSRG